MIEYITLSAKEDERGLPLDDKVNKAIGNGWKPLGGVTATSVPGFNSHIDTYLYQAMIREE